MDPVSSPFDDVQPIGRRRAAEEPSGAPPKADAETSDPIAHQMRGITALGEHERKRRERRTRNARAGSGDVGYDGEKKRRRFSRRALRVQELIAMTSELARSLHHDSLAPGSWATERRNFAVGYGVMVDKLNALSGRPTQVIALADATAHRDGALELAQRLALVRTT